MKKKITNIAGLTLIEILIAIVITSLMMAAMVTSYNLVNNSYRQVTDRAKISQAGRDIIGTMLREIRMAGFKYMGDIIQITNEHNPIRIYKETTGGFGCDVIEIVYGDVDYDKPSLGTEATYTHTRYKITYECETSAKLDLDQNKSVGYKLVKSKEKWDGSKWKSNESGLFSKVPVLDYVQDLVDSKPIPTKDEVVETYTSQFNKVLNIHKQKVSNFFQKLPTFEQFIAIVKDPGILRIEKATTSSPIKNEVLSTQPSYSDNGMEMAFV